MALTIKKHYHSRQHRLRMHFPQAGRDAIDVLFGMLWDKFQIQLS